MEEKLSARLELKLRASTLEVLKKIHANHGATPQDVLRHLAEHVETHFKKEGWFSLPVILSPVIFQKPMNKPTEKTEQEFQKQNDNGPIHRALKNAERRARFAEKTKNKVLNQEYITKTEAEIIKASQGLPAQPMATKKERKPRKQIGF